MWDLWLNISRKVSMTQHVLSVHEEKKTFNCEICDYSCSENGSLNKAFYTSSWGEKISYQISNTLNYNTVNSRFKKFNFSFLKSRVVWFKKNLYSESKNRSTEKNAWCRWICNLISFLNREFSVLDPLALYSNWTLIMCTKNYCDKGFSLALKCQFRKTPKPALL